MCILYRWTGHPQKGRGGSLQIAPSRKPDPPSSGSFCRTHGCSDSLLIRHIIPDPGVTNQVDDRGCNQRQDDDSCDPDIPAGRIDQTGNPGRRYGRVEANATGKQTQQREEVEDPVWSQPGTGKGLMVVLATWVIRSKTRKEIVISLPYHLPLTSLMERKWS